MVEITLKEIRNVFIAVIDLLFKPRNCFNREEDNDLSVSNITGFKFWFYLTFVSYFMLLITSISSNYYSIWFFVSSGIYSLLRMFWLVLIWLLIAKILGFKSSKDMISLLFFQVGLFSFVGMLIVFPILYKIGLENLLLPDNKILITEIIKNFKAYVPYVLYLYLGLVVFYSITWIQAVSGKNISLILSLLLLTALFYGLSRIYIVIPMGDFLQDYLYRIPWISNNLHK